MRWIASLREVALVAASLLLTGCWVLSAPASAPLGILPLLAISLLPWRQAWRASRGTALRGALVWGFLAIVLGMAAQAFALMEALETGRPWAGRVTYLMVLAILAFLISVLNARTPGGGAWALLMALLVVVFLIPWLEGSGRVRAAGGMAQLQLDAPWTLFYGLLVIAGVTNFLPTRYGPAALMVGLALILEYVGLTRIGWPPGRRSVIWMAVGWSLAAGVWTARGCASRPLAGESEVECLWLWFRDHWGVVWALRVQDRFNRSAELARWPVRLTWFGLAPAASAGGSGKPEVPAQAAATFRGLVRRFAEPDRLDTVLNMCAARSCDPEATWR